MTAPLLDNYEGYVIDWSARTINLHQNDTYWVIPFNAAFCVATKMLLLSEDHPEGMGTLGPLYMSAYAHYHHGHP